MAILLGFLNGLWGKVALGGVIFLIIVGAVWGIREIGVEHEQAAEARLEQNHETEASQTRDDINHLSDSGVTVRLHDFERQ